MIEQILIGILITILATPILWFLKMALAVHILRILKKAYGAVAGKFRKVKAKVANTSHKSDENYKERHGQLKASCVGMEAPISLEDVYVDVQFLGQKRASKYGSLENIEKAFREESKEHSGSNSNKRQDGMQVANDKQYLMVLGGPGIGKSTFLRKVGLEALKGKGGNFAHECTPVFLELKRLTDDSIDIEALIIRELEIYDYPNPKQKATKALKSGELLILFDGLDEAPSANDEVVRKIEDFVNQYSRNRFIASSRIGAYKGGFTRFTEVEMANFDNSQVEGYISKWFSSRPNLHQFNENMTLAQQCWKALEAPDHQATKKLAYNPLLLTLLCIVYENEQNFPSNRIILYEKVLNILLKKWSAEKHIRRNLPASQYLDISTVKKIFSEIAAKNFKADRVLFSEDELINQIQEFFQRDTNIPTTFDASKTLDTILVDPGLFVERANGVYSFFHLTFQEYLTANYFVNTQSIQRLVTEHLHDERWREVFLFTAELLPEADRLLLEMEAEAAKSIDTYRLKTLFQWTKCITNTDSNLYNGLTKRTFAILQYFSLWLFSKIDEVVKDDINPNLGPNLDFHLDLNLDSDFDDDFYKELYLDFYQSIYLNRDLYLYLYRNLDIDLDFYLDFYRGINLDIDMNLDMFLEINLYLYLCGYMEIYFYAHIPPEAKDRFDAELGVRMTLVKRIEQAKIFKNVDLQRMVHRFDAQRKFIKALQEDNVVKPPEKSIHNTWLSVLQITDDMLAISRSEVESCLQYLWLVELIVTCKESAKHVSPEVWQTIENRLLTWNAAGVGD